MYHDALDMGFFICVFNLNTKMKFSGQCEFSSTSDYRRHTGTLTDLRYSNSASIEPRVEACTNTPVDDNLMAFSAFFSAAAIQS